MAGSMGRLAILGGEAAIPKDLVKKWPPVGETDREMVLASLAGNNHAFGPNCQAFEKEFAAWNGNSFAINTNSGTAALHMSLAACGLSAGDHVLVPAYSWSSSATCVIHHNCIPVFVDIDFETMNIDGRRYGTYSRDRREAQPRRDRRRLPGPRGPVQREEGGDSRRLRGIQLQPEQ
ncbi:MAG: aminotransferase class I/II-fold pyridoxal phosphate-dependent enzyme, partial [Planctomycetota bacterium]